MQTIETPVYAGFWRRVAAWLIDLLILAIPIVIARHLAPPYGTFLVIVGEWMYFAGLESSASQATPGKRALGLRVTGADGRRISFGRATGRYFAKIISLLILGIGFLMAGWTQKKQALHDMIADTLVVRAAPNPRAATAQPHHATSSRYR